MSLEIQSKAVVVDDDLVYLQTVGLMLKKYPSGGGHLSMNADFEIASLMVAR